jgi:hypothetical protein
MSVKLSLGSVGMRCCATDAVIMFHATMSFERCDRNQVQVYHPARKIPLHGGIYSLMYAASGLFEELAMLTLPYQPILCGSQVL